MLKRSPPRSFERNGTAAHETGPPAPSRVARPELAASDPVEPGTQTIQSLERRRATLGADVPPGCGNAETRGRFVEGPTSGLEPKPPIAGPGAQAFSNVEGLWC